MALNVQYAATFSRHQEFIPNSNDEEIKDLIPDQEDQQPVSSVCNKLNDLETVTKELQNGTLTLSDAHILLKQ